MDYNFYPKKNPLKNVCAHCSHGIKVPISLLNISTYPMYVVGIE